MYTVSRKIPYFYLFSDFSNADAFCRKTNLPSHHEILTGKRQFDVLSYKGSLVAERNLGAVAMNPYINITAYGKFISGQYPY